MSRSNSALLVILVALVCLACPTPARADEAEARARFAHGVELYTNGDFSAALQEFQRADSAHHAPTITYNIARTRESLGQAQAAVEAYEAYLGEAGPGAEYANASVLAIAEIKKKSTRLRVATNPSGARVFADGVEAHDVSPVSVLLFAGHHRIAVELEGWNDGRDYDAEGGGNSDSMAFAKPQPGARAPSALPRRPKQPSRPEPQPAPAPRGPVLEGLMGGVGLSVYGYRFEGNPKERTSTSTTTADEKPTGLVFGATIDIGWALSEHFALLLRGFGGLGSAEGELASLVAGAPVLSMRVGDDWWLGAGVLMGTGRADSEATRKHTQVATATDDQITYRTDFAIGPTLELSWVFAKDPGGHWLLSLMPGALFTTLGDESTIFVPVVVGHRWL